MAIIEDKKYSILHAKSLGRIYCDSECPYGDMDDPYNPEQIEAKAFEDGKLEGKLKKTQKRT